MSEPLFKLNLPGEEPPAESTQQQENSDGEAKVVELFPAGEASAPARSGVLDRVTPAVERSLARFAEGWTAAWVGDGVLGMRPRPVMDLVRQFWLNPPPYIADALILRVPYAVYGAIVIPVTAATHLVLLIISYPSLLIGVALLVGILSLVI